MRPPPDQVKKKSKQRATGSRGDSGSGLDKPKHIPLTPPRGDVATSGGNYGTQQAEKFKGTQKYRRAVTSTYVAQSPERKRELVNAPKNKALPLNARQAVEQNFIQRTHNDRVARNREIAHDQAQHDVITEADHKTLLDWEQRVEAGDKSTHPGLPEATIKLSTGLRVPKVLFATDPSVLKRAGFSKDVGEQIAEVPARALREGIDIPKNFIPGAVYTGAPLVSGLASGDPSKALKGAEETGKRATQSYVDFYHHPGKFALNNPLATGLMLYPGGKLAANAIGKAEVRAVSGTTGVEDIKFGKGLRGKGPAKVTQMSDKAFNRRVDVNVHEARERQVPPHYNVIDEFAHKGSSGKNKAYPTFQKAQDEAAAVSKKNGTNFSPYKAGPGEHDPYYLVPDKALSRLGEHLDIGKGTPGKFTDFSRLFRQGVLMSSPKWIPGNISEAALRSLTSRSGLMDLKSGHAAQSALSRHNETGGQIWGARTTYGGHLHMAGEDIGRMGKLIVTSETAKTAKGPIGRAGNSLAEVARGARDTVTNPLHPAKGIARAYNGWSKFVFSDVNGHIEHQFQTAIQGQVLRKNKLIPRALGIKNKQLADEWAKGVSANPAKLRNLATAVGKEIDRAYGRYGKMSPGERWTISHFTPFLRWSHNALDFLYHVMPADHPVLTALAASINVATQDYRKKVGQYYSNDQLLHSSEAGTPSYLQGGVPGKNGSVLRASHYTPMGIFEQGLTGIGDLFIPQFSTILQNAGGKDWKGDKLANDGDAIKVLAALTSMVEQTVPYVSLGANAAGIRRPNMAKGQKIPSSPAARIKKTLPFTYTHVGKPASSGSGGPSFGGGSSSGGFSFGGGSSGGFDFSQ